MRVALDRLSVLIEHGLSEYQARVYLALLDFPSVNAGALAKAAQVPRNRLYEVVEELQSIGLVDVLLEDTRKYRARPISSYLDRTVSELKDRIGKIEAQKTYLDVAFNPPEAASAEDLDSGSTRVLMTRRAVAREIDRMVESAKTHLVASSSVGGWERVFRHLERATPGTLPVEVYLPVAARESGGVERLAERWGDAVRWVEAPLRCVSIIVDDKEFLLAQPIPDDEPMRVGRDFAILTTNAAMIQDQLQLLRASAAAP